MPLLKTPSCLETKAVKLPSVDAKYPNKIQLTYLGDNQAVLTLDNSSQLFINKNDAVALGNAKLRPEWLKPAFNFGNC